MREVGRSRCQVVGKTGSGPRCVMAKISDGTENMSFRALPFILPGFVAVRGVTLDGFLQHETPQRLVKCGVQGAEAEVFHTARELLKSHHPYVECEAYSSPIAETLPQFLQAFDHSLKWYAANRCLAVSASRGRP